MERKSTLQKWCCGVVTITTEQLNSGNPELKFYAHEILEIFDGQDL